MSFNEEMINLADVDSRMMEMIDPGGICARCEAGEGDVIELADELIATLKSFLAE